MIGTYDINFDEKVEKAAAKIKYEYGGDTNLYDINNCTQISRLVLMVAQAVDAENYEKTKDK